MSTNTSMTTLREMYLGVTCWFSTEFIEFYKVNRLRAQWLEFQTDNDIIIFVNQQLVYSSFQYFTIYSFLFNRESKGASEFISRIFAGRNPSPNIATVGLN